MLASTCTLFLYLCYLTTHVSCKESNITHSCAYLYEKGVEAYLDNNFIECVTNLEEATQKYKEYTKKLHTCRLKCRYEAEISEPLYPVDIDNLLFYEKALKTTLCIIKCKNDQSNIFNKFTINKEIEDIFESHKPYEYLHLCYFQLKKLQKAASAAFTYLVTHPEDKTMLATLKHYSSLDGVNINEVVNYEAKDYVYLYIHGADAYEKKEWESVIHNMEESLNDYLQVEEECRVQCEGPFDHGWYPDFIPSIANHFTYSLKCKHKCSNKLNSLNGEEHEDLLPSHYHYLQYAYFKMGNVKEACKAVASFLLFYPGDETMLKNLKYYSNLPKVVQDDFTPRREAIRYVQRQKYETKLLNFIDKEFQFNNSLVDNPFEVETATFKIIKTEDQLDGVNRFVSDGILTDSECNNLVLIAKMFAVLGDGYDGKSPHTIMEKFEGVTLGRATLLVYLGLLNSRHLELYLKTTEIAKHRVREYFHLKENLYITYTHLVCRTALPDSPKNRTDLSHAIHADNCNILENGDCERSPPAYTWRDYSAIVYLNKNFQGGDFIFTKHINTDSIQSLISPKCGRMVAFSSGPENLHGVRAVRSGTRCAIGVWFTLNSKYKERDRELAYQLLNEKY